MGSKLKWDETAIDDSYVQVLDSVGWILDQLTLTGCRSLFLNQPALKLFINLIEKIESELLLQWKIKRENGLEPLFSRQREWLNRELRNSEGFLSTWSSFRGALWNSIEEINPPLAQNPWKDLLLLTLTDFERMKDYLRKENPDYSREVLTPICALFEKLYTLCPHHLALSFLNLIEIGTNSRPDLPPIGNHGPSEKSSLFPSVLQNAFSDIIEEKEWEGIAQRLLTFWESNTGGIYSLFPACIIKKRANGRFAICGVRPSQTQSFEKLIGIDLNRDRLIKNVESFLNGGFAHHVLLWGGRGTGKSSSVLALMNRYAERGLRLIEIQPEEMILIPAISEKLKNKPEKFLLFCDDLSFDKDNTDFRHLKSILEGSVVNPSKNILLIATSNRKDLVVRGELDERLPEQKQLIDEKRAIDDRFGLKLFFEVPVYKDLQKILFGCADRAGIQYQTEDLLKYFRQFAQRNNHDKPSGRTVIQFINEWRQ
ncbi:ATP-binding protein [bacterium]|nr:ATP-binding protein [bacterium]